jgi:catechol 2,3-dioxygenase-like lactoylglutathione lyase family enzyme
MTPLIHHLTLSVSDVDVSARWYQQLLGEAQVVQRTMPGWRRVRMSWPDGLIIGVTQFDDATDSEPFNHLRIGLDHVGLSCGSEEEVREWAEKITELGFERGPVEEAPYGWVVTARDPDNIPVEFFCPS